MGIGNPPNIYETRVYLAENMTADHVIIHPRTLIYFTIFIFTFKGLFLTLAFRSSRQPFLRWLALACFSFALGWLMFAGRFWFGINPITLPLANALLLLLPILMTVSVLSFFQKKLIKSQVRTIFLILGLVFVGLTCTMHYGFMSGILSSTFSGFVYCVVAKILSRYLYFRRSIIALFIALNLVLGITLLAKGGLLTFYELYPKLLPERVVTELLSMSLFLNLICVDAQILGFPILYFMKAQSDLEHTNRQLQILSQRDELTGLFNRRMLMETLEQRGAGNDGNQGGLGLIIFDLDHFKQINDRFGHEVGDRVLVQAARRTRQVVPPSGMVVRYGGEEFIIVLPRTTLEIALEIAEQVRAAIAALTFTAQPGGGPHRVTASFGVAVTTPATTTSQLMTQADAALYRAKAQGRNQVCTADPVSLTTHATTLGQRSGYGPSTFS